jgi:LPXTG-site transpeptidase (sortase) family protein
VTEEHQRYIGVARPPQGVDPRPPRLVVDLGKPRAAAEHAAAAASAVPVVPSPGTEVSVRTTGPGAPGRASGPEAPGRASGPEAPGRASVEQSPSQGAPNGATVQHLPGPTGTGPATGPTGPTGPVPVPGPTRPGIGTATGRVKMGRPPNYGRTSGHRKRFRRAVFRRFELVVWVVAVVIAATMIVLLVRGPEQQVALAGPSVLGSGPAAASATSHPISSGGRCVFDPCPTTQYTGVPTRVRIPSIKVDSALETLVLNAQKELEPPTNYAMAGWWSGGVPPGDKGAAVIAGHVDNYQGPAVFYELHSLKPGDIVQVDRGGQTVTFTVTNVEQYPKDAFPTDRVYALTPDPELRLITCGGSFDRTTRSYRDNIVVYAILA